MPPTAVVVQVVQDATDFCIIFISGKLARSAYQRMEGRAMPCQFPGPSISMFSFSFNSQQAPNLAHLLTVPDALAEPHTMKVL